MSKPPEIFLKHIIESIEWAQKDINNLTFVQFSKNVPIQDAVIRRLEIIAEAAKNLPTEIKEAHSEIPWAKIIGMRNKLTHEYFRVDLDLVWSAVKDYLPPFKKQIEEMAKEFEK